MREHRKSDRKRQRTGKRKKAREKGKDRGLFPMRKNRRESDMQLRMVPRPLMDGVGGT